MSITTKRIMVELTFANGIGESPPYIKDWWLNQQIRQIISDNLKHLNSLIKDSDIDCNKVQILPDEITVSLVDVL